MSSSRADEPKPCALVPHITLVKLDVMFLQEETILLLERHLAVVFDLIANVIAHMG